LCNAFGSNKIGDALNDFMQATNQNDNLSGNAGYGLLFGLSKGENSKVVWMLIPLIVEMAKKDTLTS
jgi:hypothetical protein